MQKPPKSLRPKVHIVFHGQVSISYFDPKIWKMKKTNAFEKVKK